LISGESDTEVDESEEADETPGLHTRELDPDGADIYLDALWAPIYFKHERIQHGKSTSPASPRFLDYLMVTCFLLLNAALQLSIAVKIVQVTEDKYGGLHETLFSPRGACFRLSSTKAYIGNVYPHDVSNSTEFYCTSNINVLSLFPEQLDLDKDGYWTPAEAEELQRRLRERGSGSTLTNIPKRMSRYDQKHRVGSRSDGTRVDVNFFAHYRNKFLLCLPNDPNICGNLEASGKLSHLMPDLDDTQERIDACRDDYDSFCRKLFGGDYEWIHTRTAEICGEPSYTKVNGVNVVSYKAVSNYQGEEDSITGTIFVSFLVLLVFIWGMLMTAELRACYNLAYVVWLIPSTSNTDEQFSSVEDGKMVVNKLPIGHKIYSLLCICLPRFLIAFVVVYVGARFLSATNDLQDLVLNCTALGFLIEIDSMIHAAFLGVNFERRVTAHCEVISVPVAHLSIQRTYSYLIVALVATGAWICHVYYGATGLKAIGEGLDCLCHFEGDCFLSRAL